MMMTKFPTICLTILFCISASKDTTACMKMEEAMQAGKEDAGRRISGSQNYEEIVNER